MKMTDCGTTSDIADILDSLLPDERLTSDLATALWTEAAGTVEIADDVRIFVPPKTRIDVVTKAFFLERFDIGFGTTYRALLAVGGIESLDAGAPTAPYCFSTLYYDSNVRLLTIDFHREIR
jgi:hypothetical protein